MIFHAARAIITIKPGHLFTDCAPHPLVSTMVTKPPHPKRHNVNLSLLDGAIEALNLVKEASSIAPAKAVFGSASVLLSMIRVHSSSSHDPEPQIHVHLGFNRQ